MTSRTAEETILTQRLPHLLVVDAEILDAFSDREPVRVGTNFRSMISDPCESGPGIIVRRGVRIFRATAWILGLRLAVLFALVFKSLRFARRHSLKTLWLS
jgi:hypothetical protein